MPPSQPNADHLDDARCEQARRSRDPRFDGLFFTAVRTTGIYCRPTCPAPPAHARNVRYYSHAAAAEADGYRPCLRCRPELAPGDGQWRRGDGIVARALALIEAGALAEAPLQALADRLHVSERQLGRVFVERLGVPPGNVHRTRRLLFAKQLLTQTALPVTDVALAAGFASVRRFNDAFARGYRIAPRDLRRQAGPHAGGAATADAPLVLRLHYRPPFDFAALLAFLRGRALPGIEQVDGQCYRRTIASGGQPGLLQVRQAADGSHALELSLQGVAPAHLQAVVARVRRMFDLDADPRAISACLSRDAQLRPLLRAHPGLRLPSAWDSFEVAVRAVIGQQVSVAAARTITARLVGRCDAQLALGRADGDVDAPWRTFPTAAELLAADVDGIGLNTRRMACLRALATAVAEGTLVLDAGRELDATVAALTALPGIGPWTAHYIALRGLGHPDAFPAEDLVVQRQLGYGGGSRDVAALRRQAEQWRPWRGYAVLQLWQAATDAATPRASTPPTPRPPTRLRRMRSP